MSTVRSGLKIGQEAIEQAAAWFVEFRVDDADARAREDFNAWLRRSPENVQAYLDIARTYAELPAIKPAGDIDVQALIAYARSDANVVPLSARAASPEHRTSSRGSRPGRAVQVSLAASVLIVIAGALTWFHFLHGVYSTDVGEQRSVILADGSTVALNTRSRIRVRYSDEARNVELLRGQALFQVSKDPSRPFTVRSGEARVRAVGTQFDVYRRRSGTTVTVLEGRVAVLPSAPPAGGSVIERSSTVSAGEQVTVIGDRAATPKRADIAAATAWTQRRLVFEGTPLTEVAEEFNRYTTRTLIVEDATLQRFLISGSYSSADPASLLLFLRAQPELRIVATDTEIRISRND